MDILSNPIICIISILVGIVLNIFIYKISKNIFKENHRLGTILIRIVSLFLLINGISKLFHI
jgi:hypothetical protein